MKIIGHRGAAGLAPENTIASIKAALDAGVDAVEFDVRVTKDGQLVLCHDDNLLRTHGTDKRVENMTLAQLSLVKDAEGEPIPTLEAALKACQGTPALIEAKGEKWAKPLAETLSQNEQYPVFAVIAFNHHELFNFGQRSPSIPLYVLEHHNAMEALNTARMFGFEGVDLNFWLMNPLIYWLARRHNLVTGVYTLDWPWLARIFRVLYPSSFITTNVPQKLQFLRRTKKLSRPKR
jgi:glycerophosphoryl diester phosphodiesterase